MKTFHFDPASNLILVAATLTGKTGSMDLTLAVDTGASITLIEPGIIDFLGYSAKDGEKISIVSSALGNEAGYTLRIPRFKCLGHVLHDFLINVHDLPASTGVDGLLGLNFLRHFVVTIDYHKGLIRTEPVHSS